MGSFIKLVRKSDIHLFISQYFRGQSPYDVLSKIRRKEDSRDWRSSSKYDWKIKYDETD